MNPSSSDGKIHRPVVIVWTVLLIAISSWAGCASIAAGMKDRARSIENHTLRMDPHRTEAGKTAPQASRPADAALEDPSEVRVGIYVERIVDLSIHDLNWTVEFYVWFTWSDLRLDPGQTFQVVDGKLARREELDRRSFGKGQYALYRAEATISKYFDPSRFPVDDHLLTISIEDTKAQSFQLRYVADQENSRVSSRVQVSGYGIDEPRFVVKPHSYKTSRGDPALPQNLSATYSQFVCGVAIRRLDYAYYMKMFLPLFACVGLSFIGFLRRQSDRTGLQVGAFFSSTASVYVITRLLPESNISTLADRVIELGIMTSALSIGASALSSYFANKGDMPTSLWIDRLSLTVLLTAYVIVNTLIPWTAMT